MLVKTNGFTDVWRSSPSLPAAVHRALECDQLTRRRTLWSRLIARSPTPMAVYNRLHSASNTRYILADQEMKLWATPLRFLSPPLLPSRLFLFHPLRPTLLYPPLPLSNPIKFPPSPFFLPLPARRPVERCKLCDGVRGRAAGTNAF